LPQTDVVRLLSAAEVSAARRHRLMGFNARHDVEQIQALLIEHSFGVLPVRYLEQLRRSLALAGSTSKTAAISISRAKIGPGVEVVLCEETAPDDAPASRPEPRFPGRSTA